MWYIGRVKKDKVCMIDIYIDKEIDMGDVYESQEIKRKVQEVGKCRLGRNRNQTSRQCVKA